MINPLSNPAYLLPALIALCVIIGLLVLLWYKSPRDFSNALFGGFLLGLGLWSFLLFGMRSSPDTDHALLWEKALIVTAGLAFLLYYHFTLVYAHIRPKRWTLPVIYSVIVVLAIIVATTDLAVSGMYLASYGYAPIRGPLLFLFFIPAPLLIVGGAYNLHKRFRAFPPAEERNRLLYLITATVFPLVGVALDAFTDLPPASLWGNLIFCAVCSFAILKYHLLGIQVIVRKSLVYLLVSLTVATPYVIVLLLLANILKAQVEPWWVHALIVLILAILLRPVYSKAQQIVDKLFYRERYDHLQALQQFSQRAQSIVNLEELSSNIVQLICGALRASSAYLLLASDNIGGFRVASCSGSDNACPGVVLRNQSPLVKWLRMNPSILSVRELSIIPQLRNLSLREKKNLEQMEANLYVPIQTAPGQLSGILVLGQKLSQQPYSNEDRQLLTALSSQMAMALENARLYAASQQEVAERKRAEEELKQSHEQLRNLSAHIESARETERTSIAREVHDELGQALTAIKMDLSWLNRRLPKEQEALIKKRGEMSRLIDTTIQTVKRISTKLRPGVLDDLGLMAAIEWQVQEFQERTRIKCELTAGGEDINLDRDLATAVFRILQEALTNVARHANATRVKVSLKERAGQLVLQVRDNGKGITEKQIAHPKSFGLIGMRERVRSWNGSVKIDGISGKGTIVTVSIPLKRKEEHDDKNTSRR